MSQDAAEPQQNLSASGEIPPDLAEIDYLESVEGFRVLSPIQKKILFAHVEAPHLTVSELARQCEVSRNSVYRLFALPDYDLIEDAIVREEKRRLRLLALRTLRENMLCDNAMVRQHAALKILEDKGDLRDAPKILNTKKEITVTWGPPVLPPTLDVTPKPKEGEAQH